MIKVAINTCPQLYRNSEKNLSKRIKNVSIVESKISAYLPFLLSIFKFCPWFQAIDLLLNYEKSKCHLFWDFKKGWYVKNLPVTIRKRSKKPSRQHSLHFHRMQMKFQLKYFHYKPEQPLTHFYFRQLHFPNNLRSELTS